ncbi:CLUMA_CG007761, isoform A [Clunio marinus]|uniref:CLUMA_CG007761, isoform A n=1 Tax=Clunio marinus TaxID=568069 RepID=A0A1J1I5N5_9DIPT|nr:CLUMA_CG007761, isoform A [Clunio marinus]
MQTSGRDKKYFNDSDGYLAVGCVPIGISFHFSFFDKNERKKPKKKGKFSLAATLKKSDNDILIPKIVQIPSRRNVIAYVAINLSSLSK